jgi:hypothetical protein
MESTQTPWWSQTPRPSQLQHLALALISPPNTRTHKCLILLRIPSYSTRKQQNRPQDQVPWVFSHINKSDGTSRLLYNAHSYSTAEPPKIRAQPSHALHTNLLQRLPVSYQICAAEEDQSLAQQQPPYLLRDHTPKNITPESPQSPPNQLKGSPPPFPVHSQASHSSFHASLRITRRSHHNTAVSIKSLLFGGFNSLNP